MSQVTTRASDITAEISSFYSRTLLETAMPLFVHLKYAQVQDLPANAGTDTIKWRKFGVLTVVTDPLTEGVTPSGQKMSATDITATVQYYGDYVTLTDKLQYETIDPILVQAAQALGRQAADSLDQICRDVLNAGTTVQYASTATDRDEVTAAMKLTKAEIKEAVRTLKNANAKPITSMIDPSTGFNTTPVRASFVAFIHPNTGFDLEGESGFIPAEQYPRRDAMEGEIGALAGVRFIESTNAKVFTGQGLSSADVYSTLVFGQDAYGISRISGHAMENIVKPLGSAGANDPLNQRATSGWKATFVAKILQQTYMVRIEHGVTA